ncbi:MAG: hypothetical protein A2V85_11820 [Chloroflexi bacterium RBG_16_72_14]|nr:MAG: hypothetical protein A2V85_11820 [Chloroflexi bacterium RBG_16_72_14]
MPTFTTAPRSASEFTWGIVISWIALRAGVMPRRSQASRNRTLVRATAARIREIFSSSCSSQGFGTRNSRWRSSPGTMPWRRSASTTFSGTSSQSGLICRPS